MSNPTLQDYIKIQRQQGVDDLTIKNNLVERGWSEEIVNESLNETLNPGQETEINQQIAPQAQESENVQQVQSPVEDFKIEDPNAPLPLWKVIAAIVGVAIILWFVISLSQRFPM